MSTASFVSRARLAVAALVAAEMAACGGGSSETAKKDETRPIKNGLLMAPSLGSA